MCRAVRSIVQHLWGHADVSGTDYALAQTLEQAVETLPPSLSFMAFTISESPVSEELCSHLPTNCSWIYWQLWLSMWQSTLPASRKKNVLRGLYKHSQTLNFTEMMNQQAFTLWCAPDSPRSCLGLQLSCCCGPYLNRILFWITLISLPAEQHNARTCGPHTQGEVNW